MKNKKETYVAPAFEVIVIKTTDIITFSTPDESLEDTL